MLLNPTLLFLAFFSICYSQIEVACQQIIDENPNFAILVSKEVEYVDKFESVFHISICDNMYPGCGKCSGGGNAGYCETYESSKTLKRNASVLSYSNCLGRFNSIMPFESPSPGGLIVSYTGGEFGSDGILTLFCNRTNNDMFYNIYAGDASGRTIFASSKYVCKGSLGGTSAGTLFCVLLLVFVIIYLVVGVAWNKFYLQHDNTLDQLIPQYSYWVQIPGLIEEGCLFFYEKVQSLTFKKSEFI